MFVDEEEKVRTRAAFRFVNLLAGSAGGHGRGSVVREGLRWLAVGGATFTDGYEGEADGASSRYM